MVTLATKTNLMLKPKAYSEPLGLLIAEQIAGGAAVSLVCSAPGFPSIWLFEQWRREIPEFAAMIQTAQEIKANHLIEEALAIADDASQDYHDVARRDGRVERVVDNEHVARSKLRVDVRKWVAPRLNRAQWGEQKQIDIDARVLTVSLTDDELDRRLAQAADQLKIIGEGKI